MSEILAHPRTLRFEDNLGRTQEMWSFQMRTTGIMPFLERGRSSGKYLKLGSTDQRWCEIFCRDTKNLDHCLNPASLLHGSIISFCFDEDVRCITNGPPTAIWLIQGIRSSQDHRSKTRCHVKVSYMMAGSTYKKQKILSSRLKFSQVRSTLFTVCKSLYLS